LLLKRRNDILKEFNYLESPPFRVAGSKTPPDETSFIIMEKIKEKPKKESSEEIGIRKSAKKDEFGLDTESMIKAGLHFGHRASRINPKMKPYILGVRNSINIIDPDETIEKMKEVLTFIREIIAAEKTLLIVGTKIQAKKLIKEVAIDCGLPYVNERWLGGTFTNFETMRKRIEYYKDLERKKEAGELEKYTKKERAKISEKLKKFIIKFGGVRDLSKLPDAIFVIDMKKDELAVKEARKKGVKVIGVADTNVDPTLADYFIPANDDSIPSIKYILDKVSEVIKKAKQETKSNKQEADI